MLTSGDSNKLEREKLSNLLIVLNVQLNGIRQWLQYKILLPIKAFNNSFILFQ